VIDSGDISQLGSKIKGEVYNSILHNIVSYYETKIINSDFTATHLSFNSGPTFFNKSYVKVGKTLIIDLGTPIDQLGDGTIDTVLNYVDESDVDRTFTVDGITQPQVSPYFPGGISDLWNGLGVGAR